MTENFEIGEIAIVVKTIWDHARLGTECEIIAPLAYRSVREENNKTTYNVNCYRVKYEGDGAVRHMEPWQLKKKKPPQDDLDSDDNVNLKTSWKNCIWNPTKIKV